MRVLRRVGTAVIAMLLVLALGAPVSEARGGGGGGHGGGRGHGFSHHGHFHGHGRVFVGVAPWWGVGWWGPWWYDWPAYYPGYYPYYDPLAAEPPVYIERAPADQPPPAGYWYYCESAGGYYPGVQTCPEPWVKVAPREG
jgi:hypothetical protein